MKVVGITGGMGSGKTTVCRIFELLGIPVFYADDEAKKLYEVPSIRSGTVRIFGRGILDPQGRIDKKKLAGIVFNDKKALKQINNLIHPAVKKKFIAWVKKQKSHRYVIKEAAIMIESGASRDIDYLISVISPKSLRISRLILRDNTNTSSLKKRISEQLPDKELLKRSDAVILNDDKHSLIEQVLKIHSNISSE